MSREDFDCDTHDRDSQVGANNYSVEMVDTIFADTLSRGMQNAIVSQHNAQMASSSSVTNACARILQAQNNRIKPLTSIQAGSPAQGDKYAEAPKTSKKKVCSRYKRVQRKVKRAYVAIALVVISSVASATWYFATQFMNLSP